MKSYLALKNLQFGYEKAINSKTLNLEMSGGKIALIEGSNGSGKTCLLDTICGLIIPINGDVFFSSKPVYSSDKLGGFDNLKIEDIMSNLSKNFSIDSYIETLIDKYYDLKKPIMYYNGGHHRFIKSLVTLIVAENNICLDEPFEELDDEKTQIVINLIRKFSMEGFNLIISNNDESYSLVFEDSIRINLDELKNK